jgi:predicted chitinase
MGNGAEATGEGYKFRGRGYIQLTGKDNYKAFDAVVTENILETPDLVATKYPLLSARESILAFSSFMECLRSTQVILEVN